MAGSVNKVILVGNVGNDPEIRTFGNGGKVANFSLATSENWRDKQSGERKEKTEWHRVAVFNDGLVGVIERYVKKGSKLYVEGKLQTRKWTDNSGQEKYTTEIVLQGYNSTLTIPAAVVVDISLWHVTNSAVLFAGIVLNSAFDKPPCTTFILVNLECATPLGSPSECTK